ncbi:MAG: alpha/beta fold hydrolase [Haloarculaceae archaeon]
MAGSQGPATAAGTGESQTRTVSVDGRTVAYAEYGDPDGTPVLFFHGTPGSRVLGALYDEPARDRGVRVIAPDRPGYGRSSPWPDRTFADAPAFAVPVLDDAGVDRAGVVGFSGGGPHALALAATRGDRVTRVDLVASAAPPDCVEDADHLRTLLRNRSAIIETYRRTGDAYVSGSM